jgi:hypothetical protein
VATDATTQRIGHNIAEAARSALWAAGRALTRRDVRGWRMRHPPPDVFPFVV